MQWMGNWLLDSPSTPRAMLVIETVTCNMDRSQQLRLWFAFYVGECATTRLRLVE
jgi:hypothetical protein